MKTSSMKVTTMKKMFATTVLVSLSALSHAADPLNGSVWRSIDDQTKQPKAVVKFTEQKNGTLTGTIQKILTPGQETSCLNCEGKYHKKNLTGLTIVQNLKPKGGGQYVDGTILDPKTGKTYKLKGQVAGQTLNLRGYIGVSALGRNQVWQRVQ
jgi:uncharacterized protein (DUF2147 family)